MHGRLRRNPHDLINAGAQLEIGAAERLFRWQQRHCRTATGRIFLDRVGGREFEAIHQFSVIPVASAIAIAQLAAELAPMPPRGAYTWPECRVDDRPKDFTQIDKLSDPIRRGAACSLLSDSGEGAVL